MNANLDQIIGFIVMVIATIVLMIKSAREKKPENKQSAKRLRDFLESLDEDMTEDVKEVTHHHKPKPLKHVRPVLVVAPVPKAQMQPDAYHQKSTIEGRRLQSSLGERKFQSSIENRQLRRNIESSFDDPYGKRSKVINLSNQADAPSYNVIGKAGASRVSDIMSNLKSKKQMIILKEIISSPKSLQ